MKCHKGQMLLHARCFPSSNPATSGNAMTEPSGNLRVY